MSWGTVAKCAWSDKFRVPSADDLRAGTPPQLQSVLDEARRHLGALPRTSEALVWQGVPWRWTFVYTAADAPDGRATAYLIPDPNRLQICVPLAQEHIEQLPLKRMKKSIRDGIVFARNVGGIWWPTWDIQNSGALAEVFDLLARKQRLPALGAATIEA
ncbi:MAG TPA: hypothetical protein PKE29_08955 [Phycisphaerales bacterium]|nr:hypothetical protein [Phycisphaerales bacterium]